jgi:NAD(P)H-hydrate epimerase
MNALTNRQEWWRAAARRVWLPTAEEMAALDRAATGSGSIPERALIENAGREVARLVQHRWPEGRVVALAGSGHNGADALVALRTLSAWGREVTAVRCGSKPPEPDVLLGWRIPVADPEELPIHTNGAAVLLDGILGTGLSAAPREPQASIIETVNSTGVPIVAVDGPSGANFSTGAVPGACIHATLTVAFGWPKLGLLRFPARARCGDVLAVEIGFPPPDQTPGARAITAAWVAEDMLRPRAANAHKGSAGYLTLVAGQPGMAGAAVLAARAAVRGGVGIVRVVSAPENREIVQTAVPEAVFVPWDSLDGVAESTAWADAIALGPGLGCEPARMALVDHVLEARGEKPALLDADGLNLWEGRADTLAEALGGAALLTPHPGEMARLLGRPLDEIVADPPGAAREASERFHATVLLKGAPSWVAEVGAPLRVTTLLTAALATGGMGDVLTGLAGAYLAAGLTPADAASAALMVTGISALDAPQAIGHSAADVPERLAGARAALEGERLPQWQSVLIALPAAGDEVGA